jgi:hypothetical protein
MRARRCGMPLEPWQELGADLLIDEDQVKC